MNGKRRRPGDDQFLNSHFSSGGKLAIHDSIRGAGPDVLKQAVLSILEDGETVTRALKRLRPASKQAGGHKKRKQIGGSERQRRALEAQNNAKAAADFIADMGGGEAGLEEREREEAEKKRAFDRLTEAASELLDLGFEDIYQETRETLAVSLDLGGGDVHTKGTYVWHDDGQSVPRQHDPLNDISTFKDLPTSTSGRSDGAPYRKAGLGTRAEASEEAGMSQAAQPATAPGRESVEERNRRLSEATAAKGAAGAWDFRGGVPYDYSKDRPGAPRPPGAAPEPPLTRTERPPPVPKLAPLPPVPVRPTAAAGCGYPLPAAPPVAGYHAYPAHHAAATAFPYAAQWPQPPPYAGYPPQKPSAPPGAPAAGAAHSGAEYQQQWHQYPGAPPPAYPQWHP